MRIQIVIAVMGLGLSAVTQAMTVKVGDIAGKTNLVSTIQTTVNGATVTILTDAKGMSLYTFANDTANISNCSGSCLEEWPPIHADSWTEILPPFGAIRGNDGQEQLTLNGAPLYHYADDKRAGDAFGQYPDWDAIVVLP